MNNGIPRASVPRMVNAEDSHQQIVDRLKNIAIYDGITLIVAESAKFDKTAEGCTTDLDKRFYTKKSLRDK